MMPPTPQAMSRRRAGFTLLEVCLAMSISMRLIAAAVPCVTGVLKERRLRRSFEVFDALAQDAKMKSMEEGRVYVMSWGKDGFSIKERHKRRENQGRFVVKRSAADDDRVNDPRPGFIRDALRGAPE